MDFTALEGHQDMLMPGTPDIAQMRADAILLLTQLDEHEQLHTQKVVLLPAGMWNALYRLEPSGVVVKLSAGDNRFEVDFLRQAEVLNIPAPRVLTSGTLEHPTIPLVSYFLMSFIPNSVNAWGVVHTRHEMSLDSVRQLGHDLGQVLAGLHQVHLGYITRFSDRVESWKLTITDGFSPNWDNIAPNALFDDTLLPILRDALHKTGYLDFTDGTLIHCDLNLSNVLIDRDTHRLTAILDPGGYAGMPMFDLAYASMPWDHGFDFYHAMLDSYRQRDGDKFDPALFYTSILVVAYRHSRFHTPEVRESIFRDILPHLGY
jgi:aminoglycoside phosphotransferase (APT) family kinase protein